MRMTIRGVAGARADGCIEQSASVGSWSTGLLWVETTDEHEAPQLAAWADASRLGRRAAGRCIGGVGGNSVGRLGQ